MEIEDIIVFNEDYRIFICLEHEYALIKPTIYLYKEYKSLSKKQRKQIVELYRHQEAVL